MQLQNLFERLEMASCPATQNFTHKDSLGSLTRSLLQALGQWRACPFLRSFPRLEAWNKLLYSHGFMLRVVTLLSEEGQDYFREKDLCWGSSLSLHALSRTRCTKRTPNSRITEKISAPVVVEIASF